MAERFRRSLRIFHDNTKDDHSYTKGRQPPQRLQPRFRQLPGDIPRHRFPLCAAVPKKRDYTIWHSNTVVSRACTELRLQSKNADKDTDCILISVLIWWRRGGSNPLPLECHSSALPGELRPHALQKLLYLIDCGLSTKKYLYLIFLLWQQYNYNK